MQPNDFSRLSYNLAECAERAGQKNDFRPSPGKPTSALPSAGLKTIALVSDSMLVNGRKGLEDDYLEMFLYSVRYAHLLTLKDKIPMHSPAAALIWKQAFEDCGWNVSQPHRAIRRDIDVPIVEHVLVRLAIQVGQPEIIDLLSQTFSAAALSHDEKARWILNAVRDPGYENFAFQAMPLLQTPHRTAKASLLFAHFTRAMVMAHVHPGHWSDLYDVFGTGYSLELELDTLHAVLPILRERSHLLGNLLFDEIKL